MPAALEKMLPLVLSTSYKTPNAMDTIEKARIHYYHQQCLREKEEIQHLGWTDIDAQQARFRTLCAFGDISGMVLLDVGCGTGDLKAFLARRQKNFIYLGIDIIPDFIEKANRRFAGVENTYFMQGDFITDGLPEVDYIIASGALSYQTNDALFPYSVILKLFRQVRVSLSFNLLDAASFTQSPWLKAYDRNEVLTFCKALTGHVILRTGYQHDDFTITMYK